MSRRIVIVGAGPAGVGAAMAARQQDAAADIVVLTDELCEPYEKPPLSKAVLTGKAKPQDAPIAGPRGVAGHGITLKLGARSRFTSGTGAWMRVAGLKRVSPRSTAQAKQART